MRNVVVNVCEDRMDSVYHRNQKENFVVFNDQPLTFESVTDADIKPIEVKPGSKCASKAWSCNAVWFFVVRHHDIILVNVHTNKGFLCRKKSALFIEAFLEAPKPKRNWAKKLGLAQTSLYAGESK